MDEDWFQANAPQTQADSQDWFAQNAPQAQAPPVLQQTGSTVVAEPSILQKTGRAVVDTLKGFLPQSLSEVALAPVNMIPGFGQAVKPLENIAFGRPISEGVNPLAGIPVVQRIPEIIAAEKTPALSQQRFTTGAGVVADLAMVAGLKSALHPELAEVAGIPKPEVAPETPLTTEAKAAPIVTEPPITPEVAQPVPAAESVSTAPLPPETVTPTIGEQNAQQITTPTQPNGDVLNPPRPEESVGEMPANVGSEGVPQGGQGETLQPAVQEQVALGLHREIPSISHLSELPEAQFDSERQSSGKALDVIENDFDNNPQDYTGGSVKQREMAAAQDRYQAAELENYRRNIVDRHPGDLFKEFTDLAGDLGDPNSVDIKTSEKAAKAKLILDELKRQKPNAEELRGGWEHLKGSELSRDPDFQEAQGYKAKLAKQWADKLNEPTPVPATEAATTAAPLQEISKDATATVRLKRVNGEPVQTEMNAREAEGIFTKERSSYKALLDCLGA